MVNRLIQINKKKYQANKSPGPYSIPGRLHNKCVAELGPAFQPLIQQSVVTGLISTISKMTIVVGTRPPNAIPVHHYEMF